jgi:hypothetical protein
MQQFADEKVPHILLSFRSEMYTSGRTKSTAELMEYRATNDCVSGLVSFVPALFPILHLSSGSSEACS